MKTGNQPVVRDERMVAVENASYKWSTILLTYALLIDVFYRGIVRNEAAWDLLALVFVSGAISTIYQARQKTLPRGWTRMMIGVLIGMVIAAIVSVILVMIHAK
jgi:hypothetical protein